MPLYRAISKYGLNNFTITELEECSHNIVDERERYWIEYYGSFRNGYNATTGGDGRPYLDYDLICKIYLKTSDMAETARIIGCSKDSVSNIVHNLVSVDIININNSNVNGKAVLQIDKSNGKILQSFSSANEASFQLRGKRDGSHINAVCNKKRKSAYGFYWEYL